MNKLLKSTTLAVVVLVLGFGLQSCNSNKSVGNTLDMKAKLAGHWVLETLNEKNVKTAYAGQIATLEFDWAKNSIAGLGGCNRYTGGYTLTGKNQFSAPNLASTMKACMDMSLENDFTKAISTPQMTISVDAGVLSFTKAGKTILTFKHGEMPNFGPIAINAASLSGEWKLVNITQESIPALFGEQVPTMTVLSDGKITGFAGCNRFNTTYKLDGDNVTIIPAITTRMACNHLEGEGKFISQFVGKLKAMIIGNKLSLINDKGIIVLDFEKV